MLKFDGEKWNLYKHKVSYLAPYSFYADEVVELDETWVDAKIDEIELTPEQLKRFEQVQYFENAGIDDLENYILTGAEPEDSTEFLAKVIQEQERDDQIQIIKELTDFESASAEGLEKLYFLKKDFRHGIFIEKNDLVEYQGGLYVSLQDHIADINYPPDTTNYRYTVKRKGTHGDGQTPDLWIKPTGYENVYNKGDRVLYYDGKIYVSLIDGNAEEPTKDEPYNRYWIEETTSEE